MTFIIVCLVLSGCGAGTQEVALGSAEEYVQAAKTALVGQDSFTANFDATIAMNNAGRGSMTTRGTVTFVKEPLYMKVDTDMGFDNGSQRYILYLQKGEVEKNKDGVNQYMNYDGQWTEMTLHEQRADLQRGGEHGNPACGGGKLHHAGKRRQGCHFRGYPCGKAV